jgi:hypothetical protein
MENRSFDHFSGPTGTAVPSSVGDYYSRTSTPTGVTIPNGRLAPSLPANSLSEMVPAYDIDRRLVFSNTVVEGLTVTPRPT